MRPAIRVEDLAKRYGEVVAVDDLSFAVPAGATTALLGANGAGKTTTIAMLLGPARAERRRGSGAGRGHAAPPLRGCWRG